MTDSRFCHLHMSEATIRMLDFADEDEVTRFGVLPGYDEIIEVPEHLEPARPDDDETLPTKTHPSYPLGRPKYLATSGLGAGLAGGIGGPKGGGARGLMSLWSSKEVGLGSGNKSSTILHNTWPELALLSYNDPMTGEFVGGILEQETKKEVPPQMAGAKRPPLPPSPSLFATVVHPRPVPPLQRSSRSDASDQSHANADVDDHEERDLDAEDEDMDPSPMQSASPSAFPDPDESGMIDSDEMEMQIAADAGVEIEEDLTLEEEPSRDYDRSSLTAESSTWRTRGSAGGGGGDGGVGPVAEGSGMSGMMTPGSSRPRRAAAIAAAASMRRT